MSKINNMEDVYADYTELTIIMLSIMTGVAILIAFILHHDDAYLY